MIIIDKQRIRDAYQLYVAKYHEARIHSEMEKLNAYDGFEPDKYIIEVIKQLLLFLYENVERGRARAIHTMYELVKDATDATNQNVLIHKRILDYLRSPDRSTINRILEGENAGLPLLLSLFEQSYITEDRREVFRVQLSRALESMPDHPGLMLSRAIISLKAASKSHWEEAKRELRLAIDYAQSRYNVSDDALYTCLGWILAYIEPELTPEQMVDIGLSIRDLVDCEAMTNELCQHLGESTAVLPFAYESMNRSARNYTNIIAMGDSNE